MYSAIAEAIEAAGENDIIRVITICGEGRDFTAGNDLQDFLQALPRDSDDIPVWRLLRALARNTIPLVAAVQGNAVGIGTTLLLHCDLVIAEESARFSLPFVDLGLVPEAASSLLLPRLAGRRRAARYLLLGDSFGVSEASEFGLISHVVPDGSSREELDKVALRLASKPREALRLTQKLLRRSTAEEMLERMRIEGELFSERLQSAEVGEAIAAFFRRKPSDGA
jgi:enoyl-CoA hydratase/carnithine racemase